MTAPTSQPEKRRASLRRLVAAHGELVAALDELYPAAPPSYTDDDRMVWIKAGERRVVEHLLTLQRESNTRGNILED